MGAPEKKRPKSSFHAFIEQTAEMLRSAATSKKKRKITKKSSLSASNKIEQIAKMLRSQVKIPSRKKKKSD